MKIASKNVLLFILLFLFLGIFLLLQYASHEDTSSEDMKLLLTASLNTPFSLSVGQTAQFGAMRVTLENIISDTRCPQGMNCEWAGEAVTQVALEEAGEKTSAYLSSLPQPPTLDRTIYNLDETNYENGAFLFGEYSLSLTGVLPERLPEHLKTEINLSNYRLTFVLKDR